MGTNKNQLEIKYLEQLEERPAYTPPTTKLIPISTTILNNSSGSGDGDSALAHS